MKSTTETTPVDYDLVFLEERLQQIINFGITRELNVAMAKLDVISRESSGSGSPTLVNEKSPISFAAYDAKLALEEALSQWVTVIARERRLSPVSNTIEGRARFLLSQWNLQYVTYLPEWYDLSRVLANALGDAVEAIDLPMFEVTVGPEKSTSIWSNVPARVLEAKGTPPQVAKTLTNLTSTTVTAKWVRDTVRNRDIEGTVTLEEKVIYEGGYIRRETIEVPTYRVGDLLDVWIMRTEKRAVAREKLRGRKAYKAKQEASAAA
jgi:hypothetical protein